MALLLTFSKSYHGGQFTLPWISWFSHTSTPHNNLPKQLVADTILLYIYFQLRKSAVKDAVVIDAEDTDVLVLVSYGAHQIEGMLGLKGRKAQLIAQHSLIRILVIKLSHFTSTLVLMLFPVYMAVENHQSLTAQWSQKRHESYLEGLGNVSQWHHKLLNR